MEYSFHYNVSKPMNLYSKNIKQSFFQRVSGLKLLVVLEFLFKTPEFHFKNLLACWMLNLSLYSTLLFGIKCT